jgi:hypothetical protein
MPPVAVDADASLCRSGSGDLPTRVRLSLDCVDICLTVSRQLSRHAEDGGNLTQTILLRACVEACLACMGECDQHADDHEQDRRCAEACGRANGCWHRGCRRRRCVSSAESRLVGAARGGTCGRMCLCSRPSHF